MIVDPGRHGRSLAGRSRRRPALVVTVGLGVAVLLLCGILIGWLLRGHAAESDTATTASATPIPTLIAQSGTEALPSPEPLPTVTVTVTSTPAPASGPTATPTSESPPAPEVEHSHGDAKSGPSLKVRFSTHDLPATVGFSASTFTTARVTGGAAGVADRINATLKDEVNGLWKDVMSWRDMDMPQRNEGSGRGWTEQRLEEVSCRSGLLCLRLLWDGAPPGGNTHAAQVIGLVFDESSGRRLRLSDVLTPAQKARLMPLLRSAYALEIGAVADETQSLEVITGHRAWWPTPEGLGAFVYTYALGTSAFQTVIPWEEFDRRAPVM